MQTISIVDDDRGTRELIADKLFGEADFECKYLYSNAEEAIKGILANPTDIVLMDINMPGSNGIECVRRLKPWLENTDFVMLTAYDESELIFQALEAGAIGYLLKRSIVGSLVSELRKSAEGGSPMDSSIARLVVESFQKPAARRTDGIGDLSERQLEVLQQMARGRSYKVIADDLEISIHTLNSHIRRIYEKLQVNSRAEAAAILSGLE
ncbi:MAG: response regulator transcription factor [Pontiellaceae bacterium]|nr:response regulator transcription factor [Pontiellaceae bacterium]MBN2785432.1 response regulator transcription factor [Pontiellaceae bacterium]